MEWAASALRMLGPGAVNVSRSGDATSPLPIGFGSVSASIESVWSVTGRRASQSAASLACRCEQVSRTRWRSPGPLTRAARPSSRAQWWSSVAWVAHRRATSTIAPGQFGFTDCAERSDRR